MKPLELDFENQDSWFETVWAGLDVAYDKGYFKGLQWEQVITAMGWIRAEVEENSLLACENIVMYNLLRDLGLSEFTIDSLLKDCRGQNDEEEVYSGC